MKTIKLWLTTIAVLLCSLTASAHDFDVNGIYYNITSEVDLTVEVTYRDQGGLLFDSYSNEYSGAVTIPSTVTYNSKTYSVTSIKGWAFYKCSSLTSITIPEGVTSIGSSAFRNCSSLTSITLPEGVTSIGSCAFMDCSSLTSITLPESVTSIGNDAFRNCSSLTSIVVAKGNTVYDSRNGCNAIIETSSNILIQGCSATIIPESVTSIGDDAFYGCSSLTSITLPEGVTSIGDQAFTGCSSLTSITIPEGVTSIGDWAFMDCSSLTSITLPESVTSIGSYAFEGTAWYNNQPDGVVYVGKVLCDYKGTMPENTSIEVEEGTLSISPYAFFGCSSLTSITIPEGVTSIGDDAFYNCSSLTSITIPEGVTSIGDYAFYNCSGLTSITIPESVTSIGSYAFEGTAWYNNQPDGVVYVGKVLCDYKGTMPENTSIEVEEGTLSIRSDAFRNCSGLTSITIPESVTSIGDDAFYNCTNLYEVLNFSDLDIRKGSSNHGYVAYYAQKVVVGRIIAGYIFTIKDGEYFLSDYVGGDIILSLPKDYNGEDYEIEEEAFKDNDSIVSVTIPQTVGTVGKSAFAECSNLKEVTLARGVMSIEDNAFENCTSLATIVIPQNMKTIGNSAFAGCMGLVSVSFKEGIETIGNNAFENCASITSILFPESLTAIGEKAFSGCSGLTSLSCSANIETYGEGAFEGCAEVETLMVMGSVMPTVPSNKLTSITLFSPRPLETEPFANKVYRNATLYVPEGSLSRYQSADVWEDFWNIKEFDPTGIADVTVAEDADAPIYNMKGVRVNGTRSTLPAGLYIQNGKTFVVM